MAESCAARAVKWAIDYCQYSGAGANGMVPGRKVKTKRALCTTACHTASSTGGAVACARHCNICRLQAHPFDPLNHHDGEVRREAVYDVVIVSATPRNLLQVPPVPATHGICRTVQNIIWEGSNALVLVQMGPNAFPADHASRQLRQLFGRGTPPTPRRIC
ncbi:hypothetical protein VTI28DRAFT_3771 [Corynascus sepedonium]